MMTNEQPLWKQLRGSGPPILKKRRSRKVLEANVLKECREWLLNQDKVVYVERRNTGAMQLEDRFVPFGVKGGADLWCLIEVPLLKAIVPEDETFNILFEPNKYYIVSHVEIECKRRDGKGRMSDAQKKFQARCKKIGVPYFVVTSAKDLEQQLKEEELL